ncbi:MAG TPA: sodium:proton antiporter, partial [Deferrisomatales bacterium]|nr:sodium:proton antiporter [Deferrisomatales bacterium]
MSPRAAGRPPGLQGRVLWPAVLLVLGTALPALGLPDTAVEAGIGARLPLVAGMPFVALLLSIAVLPQAAPKLWQRHHGKIAAAWGLAVAVPFTAALGAVAVQEIANVLLADYVPFIILLWTLYTVTGGLLVEGGGNGTPASNAVWLLAGTALAGWIGTTGAAMLLIRPLLRANGWRRRRAHTVVFFIFLVCNVGGSLTPLGDPPLFLGFLHGVPFLWTLRLLPVTAAVTGLLLGAHFLLDSILLRAEAQAPPARAPLRVEGVHNLLLLGTVLAVVIASGALDWGEVGALGVGRDLAGLTRDAVLLLCGALSLRTTPGELRQRNGFSWVPIREVALLFPGIFVAMLPVVLILKAGAQGRLAFLHAFLDSPAHYFWVTGGLSSVLDNTPTYLVFLGTALGAFSPNLGEPAALAALLRDNGGTLVAISAGAVFMGATT